MIVNVNGFNDGTLTGVMSSAYWLMMLLAIAPLIAIFTARCAPFLTADYPVSDNSVCRNEDCIPFRRFYTDRMFSVRVMSAMSQYHLEFEKPIIELEEKSPHCSHLKSAAAIWGLIRMMKLPACGKMRKTDSIDLCGSRCMGDCPAGPSPAAALYPGLYQSYFYGFSGACR